MNKKQISGSRNGNARFARLVTTLLLSLALGSVAQAKEYYTFHNSLAGVAITDCEVGRDFMQKNFPTWVNDGEREWTVERIGVGPYSYFFLDDCDLYTNSLTLKFLLTAMGIPKVLGYLCIEQDLQ